MSDPVTVMCEYPDCNVQATVAFEDTKNGVWFCHGHDWAKDMSVEQIIEHDKDWKANQEKVKGKFGNLPFYEQLPLIYEMLKQVDAKLDKLSMRWFGETF